MLQDAVTIVPHVFGTPIDVPPGESDVSLPGTFKIEPTADPIVWGSEFATDVKLVLTMNGS